MRRDFLQPKWIWWLLNSSLWKANKSFHTITKLMNSPQRQLSWHDESRLFKVFLATEICGWKKTCRCFTLSANAAQRIKQIQFGQFVRLSPAEQDRFACNCRQRTSSKQSLTWNVKIDAQFVGQLLGNFRYGEKISTTNFTSASRKAVIVDVFQLKCSSRSSPRTKSSPSFCT